MVGRTISLRARDRWSRTLVKTFTYRVFMFLITAGVALFVTGNLGDAASIGIATNLLKTVTYYGYERIWSRVLWGVNDPGHV
ncbi:MAG: DUF2061 domain-containing protein [Natronomonas sp.]